MFSLINTSSLARQRRNNDRKKIIKSSFYVKFALVFMKTSTPFRHTRYHGCYEDSYNVIILVIQAFMM